MTREELREKINWAIDEWVTFPEESLSTTDPTDFIMCLIDKYILEMEEGQN